MKTINETKPSLEQLLYVPSFARYLLEQRLAEYVRVQIQLARSLNVPMLRYLKDFSEEALTEFLTQSAKETLGALAANKAKEQIEKSLRRWVEDQLQVMRREDVVAEDITLTSYLRKKTFLHFVADYTGDIRQAVGLIGEIDLFLHELETGSTNTYLNILKDRIDEDANFIQKINNTSPSIIYVFDLQEKKLVYVNNKTTDTLGYTPEEVLAVNRDLFSGLFHPEDIDAFRQYRETLLNAEDGKIYSVRYRVKDKKGSYRWMRNYDTLFKRTDTGEARQIIGVAIDIDAEKTTAEKLKVHEAQLLEAQSIAQVGNFVWNFDNNSSSGSPQLFSILEIEPDDFSGFFSKVHPQDKEKVEKAIRDSLQTGQFSCEFRYAGKESEKTLWTKGIVHYEKGQPLRMTGTVMDITERSQMFNLLRQNESLFRQAEALTHIGSYRWNLQTNELQWSDELLRIYELEKENVPVSIEVVSSLNHPEDAGYVKEQTSKAIAEKKGFDFYYRIITGSGKLKILHARGNLVPDDKNEHHEMVGTVQDETERQLLLSRLKHTDELYKQAEELANMGNYTMDLLTNEVEWTDQLYRIYDLEPQSEKVSYDRFLSFVHPQDKKEVEEAGKKLAEKGSLDYSFRIVTHAGNIKRIHSIAHIVKDESGKPVRIIGTEQDVTERQDLMDKLRQSQMLYRQAEEMALMGNWSWDLLTNKLEWTDNLYHIYGLKPGTEEITIERFLSFVHPDDRSDVELGVEQAFTQKQLDFTFRIITPDGKTKTLRSIAQVQTDENGVPIYVVGTERDITEKQKLINELKHRDNLYKQAQQLAHIGNWSWNIIDNKVEWSDELYRIFQMDKESGIVNFEMYAGMLHPDDREMVIQTIHQSLEDHKPYSFYHRIQLKDGSVKVLQAYGEVKVDKEGKVCELVGTAQDVTERQNLISRLQESQNLYQQAQSLAKIGNWTWFPETGKVDWSHSLYDIYELPYSEEISYESVAGFMHPDDREPVLEYLQECLRTGETYDRHHRIVLRSGKVKTIHRRAEIIKDAVGKPVKVVGTTQDITERQNLIERLQESEKLYKQAQALAHLGNFAWDLETNEVFWSEEVYRIYDKPLNSPVTFKDAFIPILPAYQATVQAAIETTIATKKGQSVSYAISSGDAPVKYINLETDILLDRNGNVAWIIGTAQDITERQTLIEQLQQSQRLYQQAQALAHLGNWSIDLRTMIFEWSNEMYNIYEIESIHGITAKAWEEFIHPEDREDVLTYLQDCIREKKTYDKIHRIVLAGGKIKTIHRKGEITYDEEGNALYMVGTTQDVTEQHRVQQELKENQTFLRKITDATPSIIASYNINTGKYVFISEGMEKLLGYRVDEIMEKGILFFQDIIHPDDLKELMEKNIMALEEANAHPDKNDIVFEFTYRMRHKNGAYRWFHTYGTIFDRNRENKVEHILNISLDVTAQFEATEKIKEQEHFIQQIADASPTILYLYDVPSQSMVYINREIFFVLGYIPEEIIEAGPEVTSLLYHPEDFNLLPERKLTTKKFQQADSMIQYECRMKNKDGEWRWLLVREIAFKTDEAGKVKQILGAALDINRRKEMEKTLLQNSFMLEQSNASLEEFAYVASHDLKEPLRKISTFGDRLVENEIERMDPTSRLYLKKIVDASQRMQTMITDLLSISMISGNRSFEPYSLQKVLEENLQTLEYKIEQLNAIVETDPLPEIAMVPSQFRQLFQNLLSNSLKFVRDGVQPKIIIRYALLNEDQAAAYQIKVARHYHKIEIADNGIGFENEFAGKIFAIFQRLHGRSEYEGSGIGLAICKKIVEHHGGIIFANSQLGQGSTFTIILPV